MQGLCAHTHLHTLMYTQCFLQLDPGVIIIIIIVFIYKSKSNIKEGKVKLKCKKMPSSNM